MNHKVIILVFLLLQLSPSVRASDLGVSFRNADGEPVVDAIIEIVSPEIPVPDNWDYRGLIDQVDKEFIGNVITIVIGSYVSFPNSDDIQHHVYSFSDNNNFDLPLYSGTDAEPVLFDVAGVSVVGCNIHDWMLGYIYVGESHLMAKSDATGLATINNLSPGEYTFKIWHERTRRSEQFSTYEVSIPESGVASVEIELDLGRDRRIRRAPSGSGSSYH